MADSIMLSTARAFEATVWAQDAYFDGLDGVQFVPPSIRLRGRRPPPRPVDPQGAPATILRACERSIVARMRTLLTILNANDAHTHDVAFRIGQFRERCTLTIVIS